MRKLAYIVVLLFGVMASPVWSASKLAPNERHYLSIWGQAGYATLLNDASAIKPGPGVSPALGLGYRYYRGGLIVQAGIEGQYSYYNSKIQNTDINLDMMDTEGDLFVMNARVVDCKDMTQAINLNIPLLIGYEYRHFYFLGGASLGLGLYGTAKTNAKIATKATYDWAIDPFEDMPNHQLQSSLQVNSRTYQVNWKKPSLNAHLEVGARVDRFIADKSGEIPVKSWRLYVAAFAEYGVLNVHEKASVGETFSYKQEPGGPLQWEVVPAMVSQQMLNAKVNPLVVGLKLTFIWQLPEEPICIICKD